MKKVIFWVASISGLLVLGAVARTVGGGNTVPQEIGDPYFQPRGVYSVNIHQAWNLIMKALMREGISMEMTNKDTGLMRTGYQYVSAFERNKCDIRFSQKSQQETFIYVRCRYESREKVTEPFRDQTYILFRKTMKAEEEIYKKFEPYILPFERIQAAKAEPKTAALPAREGPSPKAGAISPPVEPTITEVQPRAPSVPSPQGETPLPKTEAVSSPPARPTTEATIQPATPPPPVTEGRPGKPEVTASSAPAARERPPQAEISKEPSKIYLATITDAEVRLATSTKSKIMTTLKKGEEIEKVGVSGDWTKVKLPSGDIGWVQKDFLREVGPRQSMRAAEAPRLIDQSPIPSSPAEKTPPASPGISSAPVAVKPDDAREAAAAQPSKILLLTKVITNMRAEPNPTSNVVLVLKKRREAEKIGESGEYTRVRLSWGTTGWVLTRDLEKVP